MDHIEKFIFLNQIAIDLMKSLWDLYDVYSLKVEDKELMLLNIYQRSMCLLFIYY